MIGTLFYISSLSIKLFFSFFLFLVGVKPIPPPDYVIVACSFGFLFFLFFFLAIILKILTRSIPIRVICFAGSDLRVKNIQLFFHRRVYIGVRDENVGSRTSALREGQVRVLTRRLISINFHRSILAIYRSSAYSLF